jgi:predicted nucleic acid-binding protein
MEQKEFIKQQLGKLQSGSSKEEVRQNVFKFCVQKYFPNEKLDALIDLCMELYAEISIQFFWQTEVVNRKKGR